jgi:hypothetical protein
VGKCQHGRGRSGQIGRLGHHLLDERDELTHGAALDAQGRELDAEVEGGVGLPAGSAELESLSGQPFHPVQVAGDQRP